MRKSASPLVGKLSVIVPVLNEAACLPRTLDALQPLRQRGHEVIVADGGSSDSSEEVARYAVDLLVRAPRGRARQMNAGANRARGDVLLFLHADTILPAGADHNVLSLVPSRYAWGRFDVEFSPARWQLFVVQIMMNWRSRVTGIATGDQALFVTRPLFEALGGFPDVALMEDVRLSKMLKRHGRPLCLRDRATTSSRRWVERGVWRTIWLMWSLRLKHALGADPARLHDHYHGADC